MTIAVDLGYKATKQTNKRTQGAIIHHKSEEEAKDQESIQSSTNLNETPYEP